MCFLTIIRQQPSIRGLASFKGRSGARARRRRPRLSRDEVFVLQEALLSARLLQSWLPKDITPSLLEVMSTTLKIAYHGGGFEISGDDPPESSIGDSFNSKASGRSSFSSISSGHSPLVQLPPADSFKLLRALVTLAGTRAAALGVRVAAVVMC